MDSDIFANNSIVIDMVFCNLTRDQVNSRQALEVKINQSYFSIPSNSSLNTSIGRPKYKALPIAKGYEFYVGNQITDNSRGMMKIKYPY